MRLIDPFSARFLLSKELPTGLPRMIPGPEMDMPGGHKGRLNTVQNLIAGSRTGSAVPLRSRGQGIPRPPWPFRRPVGITPVLSRRPAGSLTGGDFQVRPGTSDRLQRQPRATGYVCCLGASPVTLRGVQRFRIEASAIRETVEAIRSAGQGGYESFVLWSGTRDDDTFHRCPSAYPRTNVLQTRYRTLREN